MRDFTGRLKRIDEFDLFDAETVKLILSGDSVVDWYRLNLHSEAQAIELLEAMEYRPKEASDRAHLQHIAEEAISFLRRHFDFPMPKPVERASIEELMLIASGKERHRRVCACTILKAMHIVHHVECRELLFTLPMSMQKVFELVEEKVYRLIGEMMGLGLPIVEFIGGRKNKDSLYTKLLSKPETTAANVYDRLRFRIVTRGADDVLPTILHLSKFVFPFHQVVPRQSLNTMFRLKSYLSQHEAIAPLVPQLQLAATDDLTVTDNAFSGASFRAVHFVADVPVRIAKDQVAGVPSNVLARGPVVSVLSEFQIVDKETEIANEFGDASHTAYKNRQKKAVARRIMTGSPDSERRTDPVPSSRNRS